MFVLPAITAAFIVSFPMIYLIYASLLSDNLGYMPSIFPSFLGVSWALFIGVVIPVVSSIVPIRRGLSANLTETLDVNRSKSKGAEISIVDNKAISIAPYILQGTVAVVTGVIVYFFLPKALLELNLGLIF